MELRKNWFPLMLAATWMVLCAAVLLDFAKFNAATSSVDDGAVARTQQTSVKHSAGRRALRPATAIR